MIVLRDRQQGIELREIRRLNDDCRRRRNLRTRLRQRDHRLR